MADWRRERALRVLDANRNRAQEGLRAVEEYARFVLEAPLLSRQLKELRHAVVATLAPLSAAAREQRDVAADPGNPQHPTAPPEASRDQLGELLGANLSRVKEALRCLEEYSKPLDPNAAHRLSQLRFRAYELELAFQRPLIHDADHAVYVLLQEQPGRPPLEEQLAACLAGGIRLFQLRGKGLSDRELLQRTRRLLAQLVSVEEARLVLNDRADIARLAEAHGVHLGQDDLPCAEVRRIVGPGRLIGASAHDESELRAALEGGADYLGFGTLYASPTKPELGAQGLEALRRLAPCCPLPIYGIGGITSENAAQVIAAGASGVAVSSAILDAPAPEAEARQLLEVVRQAHAATAEGQPS